MKKFTMFLFSLLVISFAFCNHSAFAASNVKVVNIQAKVDTSNAQIQALIDKGVAKTTKVSSNQKQDIQTMTTLINKTNKVANALIIECAKYGTTVTSVYVPITINGITYWVDPMRVSH